MSLPAEPVSGAAESLALGRPLPRVRMRRPRSDRSLIAGAAAGVEADLELLFRRHWPRAFRAAFLIVGDHAAAEDVTQEAFLAAIRTLDRFDRRRPFAPWLSAIVSNRAIDCARARRSRREVSDLDPEGVCASDATGYSEEVLAALSELSPEHRTVVVMRYLLEFTPGEIARALELPRGTVNSRLRRGLDVLQSRLREADAR